MKDWWNALDKDKRVLIMSVAGMWVAQIVYLLSPIDLVPDFIPLAGQLDDVLSLASTGLFTWWAVRQLRSASGFDGLVPEALRPRSVAAPVPDPQPQTRPDPHEALLDGQGDDMGIDGYRPLSLDELKAL